jgi:general secretion pathway protein A
MVRTDTETAFLALLRVWGLAYTDLGGKRPCDLAAGAGLKCIYRQGDWTTLQRYNRPAILELIDGAGRRHHVAIVSLEEKEVSVSFADQMLSFPRAEIGEYWFGSFLLIWKPPFSTQLLAEGSSGPEVIWLREQLYRSGVVSSAPEGTGFGAKFDETLKGQVMDFQLAHGLKADGMVGEQTLIRLNTLKGDLSIPLLCGRNHSSGGREHVIYP